LLAALGIDKVNEELIDHSAVDKEFLRLRILLNFVNQFVRVLLDLFPLELSLICDLS
jgi:hypothetical protein